MSTLSLFKSIYVYLHYSILVPYFMLFYYSRGISKDKDPFPTPKKAAGAAGARTNLTTIQQNSTSASSSAVRPPSNDSSSLASTVPLHSRQTSFGSSSSENAFLFPSRETSFGAAASSSFTPNETMQVNTSAAQNNSLRLRGSSGTTTCFPPMATQTPRTTKQEARLPSDSTSGTRPSPSGPPRTPPKPALSNASVLKRIESSPGIDAALGAFEDGQREGVASANDNAEEPPSPMHKSRLALLLGIGAGTPRSASARNLLANSPLPAPDTKPAGSITAISSPLATRSQVTPPARFSQPTNSSQADLRANTDFLASTLVSTLPKFATLEEVVSALVSGASGKFIVKVQQSYG